MGKFLATCLLFGGLFVSIGRSEALAAPGPEPFVIGKARVTALQDMPGEMPVDLFRGASEKDMEILAASESVPGGTTVFLIQDGGKNILVDTGFGLGRPERESALPDLLQELGLEPDAIDAVLLTHMHGDHIGGLVREGRAAFPKATVFVNEKELAFWSDAETLRAQPDLERNAAMVKEVQRAYGGRLKVFAFDAILFPGITAKAATGHTPGHTLFSLVSNDERLLFWGDLVHGAALQFPNPGICAVYDMDMEEAVNTRREVMATAAAEKIPVAGAHLPFPALGRVAKAENEGQYLFTPGL
ncbi:MAG: MBL fold metallo-hydrolase [Deltaproteobacteria bacterium]|nr:MBL fold metallo-hydrolase [Deltaproteobacteria bacterium]